MAGRPHKYSTFDRTVRHSPRGRVEAYPKPRASRGPSDAELRALMTQPGVDGSAEGCMSCSHHFTKDETFYYGTSGRKLLRVCVPCAHKGKIKRIHMVGQVRPVWAHGPVSGHA